MNRGQRGLLTAFVFAGFLMVLSAPRVHATPRQDFDVLETELLKLHENLQKERQGQGDADARIPLTTDAGDPRLALLKQMDALAERTAGQPEGAYIAIWTFNYSWQLDLDLADLFARYERVSRNDINDASIGDVLTIVPEAYPVSAEPAKWTETLEKIAARTTRESTRHDALFALGQVHFKEGHLPQARATFAKLEKMASPGSDFARQAKGFVFEIERLQVGMPAPEFTAKKLDGGEIKLSSLRGKTVLLNFWATWCVPCLAKVPAMQQLNAALKDEGLSERLEIVSISLDDFREMLDGVIEAKKVPGIHTWDSAGRENPVAELYNVQKLPVWYVIDAKGIIRKKNPDAESLLLLITSIIADEK